MKKGLLYFNIIVLLLLLLQSCQEYKKRDLSNRIFFSKQLCENDSAEFFIQRIELIDVDRSSGIWLEGPPCINLHILIKNKLTKDLIINTTFNFKSNFAGILKDSGDTVYFRNDFLHKLSIPKGDTLIVASSEFPFWFDYEEHGDNTDLMLSFVKEMDFYYIPLVNEELDTNAYYLNKMYCLSLSHKTKVSSRSQIR